MRHTCSHDHRRTPQRRLFAESGGFTLIELLAASVLAALMASIVLAVLTSCFADVRRVALDRRLNPSTGLLREQLRRDIQNATGLQSTSGILSLYGYIATDPLTRMPTLDRARVVYRPTRLGDHLALVREEQTLPKQGFSRPTQSEIVWHGLGQLTVDPLDVVDGEQAGIPSEIPPDTGGLPPVPSAVRIVLSNVLLQPILNETIVHHREF